MSTKKCVVLDLGYVESEYEDMFGRAPWNEESRLPTLKRRNLLPCRSWPGTRNEAQVQTSRKIWGQQVKTWCPVAYTLRDRRSTVQLFFLTFKVPKLDLVFGLSGVNLAYLIVHNKSVDF